MGPGPRYAGSCGRRHRPCRPRRGAQARQEGGAVPEPGEEENHFHVGQQLHRPVRNKRRRSAHEPRVCSPPTEPVGKGEANLFSADKPSAPTTAKKRTPKSQPSSSASPPTAGPS